MWWNRIDVYSDEIVINIDPKKNDKDENEKVLKKYLEICIIMEEL